MVTFVLSSIGDILWPARLASPAQWVGVGRRCEAMARSVDAATQPIERLIARAILPMLVRALAFVLLNGAFSFLAAMSLSRLLAQLSAGHHGFLTATLGATVGWTYLSWLTLNHVFVHAQTVGAAAKTFSERISVGFLGESSFVTDDVSVASFIDRECGRIENAWGGSVMVALAMTTLVVSGAFFVIALGPAGVIALVTMGLASWVLWRLAQRLSYHYEQLSVASQRRVVLTSFVSRARRSVVLNGWVDDVVSDHAVQRSAEEVPLRRIARLVAAVNAISSITPVLALLLAAISQLAYAGSVSVPALLAGIAVIGNLKSVANGIPDAISNLTQGRVAHEGLNRATSNAGTVDTKCAESLPARRGKHVSIGGGSASDRLSVLLGAASATEDPQFIYVPSEPTPFSGTVREFLTSAAAGATQAEMEAALRTVRLDPAIMVDMGGSPRLMGGAGRRVSRGQAKRLELARALLSGAGHVYLDQPSMGLDGGTREGLLGALLGGPWRATAVTYTTAYRDEAELADEAWTVSDGGVSSSMQTPQVVRQACATQPLSASVIEQTGTAAQAYPPVGAQISAGYRTGVISRLRRGGFLSAALAVACMLTLKEGLSIAGDAALTTSHWNSAPSPTIAAVAVLLLATTAVAVGASIFTVRRVVTRSTDLCSRFFLYLVNSASAAADGVEDPLGRATRDQRRIDEGLPALMLESWGAAALLAANVAYVVVIAPTVAVYSVPLAAALLLRNILSRPGLLQANSVEVSHSSRFLQGVDDLTGRLPDLDRQRRTVLVLGWLNHAMQDRALSAYENIRRQRSFGYQIDLIGLAWFFIVMVTAVRAGPSDPQMALGLSLSYSLIAIFGRSSRTFLQLDQLLESSDRLLIAQDAKASHGVMPSSGQLTFDDVSFQRKESMAPTLRALTATIPAGTLAIVLGPSGMGKSTMASLICGELAPNSGHITIGGVPVPAPGAFSDLVQVLDASPLFKPGPLFAHFGADSPYSLETYAEILGLQHVLAALPGGGSFVVPGAGELPLPKREAQMMALIRLVTRPPLVAILDEATSELQAAEERAFISRLKEACARTTIVAITHNVDLCSVGSIVIEFCGAGVVKVTSPNMTPASSG